MKLNLVSAAKILGALAMATGCNSYKSKLVSPADNVMPASISYPFVMEKVFQPHCARCHSDAGGNDGDLNFETYDNIIASIHEINYEALTQQTMPPKKAGGALPSFEQAILRTWIEAGAPKDEKAQPEPMPSPDATPTPTPEPLPSVPPTPVKEPVVILPVWTEIHDKIFVPKCIKCHSAGGKAEDVPLDSKEFVIDPVNSLVTAGQPDQSELFVSITKVGKGQMPPVKSGIKLVAEEIDAIKTWILNGAKD